jgi:cilia- and flagella-associated protein 57
LAVGCCDKLRLYHLLEGGLRNYREVVLRGVVQLKFSNGGHMLAVAYPRQKHNIHMINVYNSYTLEEIARLSDHSNLITELCWRADDKFLYSVGTDGTIAEWKYVVAMADKDGLGVVKEWPCKKWNQNNSRYCSVIC